MLDTKERLPGLSLSSPFLSLAQMDSLHRRNHDLASNLPLAVLDCVFNPACNLLTALDDLCSKAIELVRGGAAILLLTDRGCGEQAHSDSDGAGDGRGASCADSRRASAFASGWRWKRRIAAICIMLRCCWAWARARSARGWRWKRRGR